MFDPTRPPYGPHANGMMGFVNNLEQITQKMGQMFVQTLQHIAAQDMQKHDKSSLYSETLIVQSMYLR